MKMEGKKFGETLKAEASIIVKFKSLWLYYILQSLLAMVSLFALVLILGKDKMVLLSAMGATAFIVFAMPKSASAQTRNVIGGYFVGILTGTIFYYTPLAYYIEYPLVVGTSIFFMVALDFEHPPAAGTALAVVINEVSFDIYPIIMLAAIVLTQVRYFLRHRIKDLV